jgi:multidrug efflux pump subunit AcrB
MWIVRLALRRPYTFVVMAMLIVLLGGVTIARMPTDIFPEIDIPVIAVVWNYQGLSPDEMDKRIVANYERGLTTTVNDIEHIESQTLYGVAVIKIFFQPNAKIEAATAQVTAISQTALRQFPPGATPPLIIRYSASTVPILQASLGSDTLTEQQITDIGQNALRGSLAVVQGAQIPYPYGGKTRQVMVDLDPEKLHALGLSPGDVSAAVNAQNLILPGGTAKFGPREYTVRVNGSPEIIEDLNNLPVKTVNGTTVYVRDVAHVRDGFAPQASMVHADGKKGALLPILKAGGSSTLDIVRRVREALPGILATLPKEFKLTLLFDQSVFVRAAVEGVIKEAAIAAGLTGLMILLFLGSWRSTLIVVVSIPLSILVSIIVLYALGQTLNVMTLGGMALAVGILVDDATVEIENIHRNLAQKKPLVRAILDGAQQIAVPAFVSTLCICIVFVPVGFITGAAKSLFVPLAMAVVFAMMTSYLLSRTLVPTMVKYLLGPEAEEHQRGAHGPRSLSHDGAASGPKPRALGEPFRRFHDTFNRAFERLRQGYGLCLAWTLAHRRATTMAFGAFVVLSFGLLPLIGQDFFPSVDAGQIRLHVRCPPGTRVEETERTFAAIEDVIREQIPPGELSAILDNMGIPVSGINLALGDPSMVSSADGEILISLDPEKHGPTPEHVKRLRKELGERFPDVTFFFLAPDISTQVLNFGISAPIDVQLVASRATFNENLAIAAKLRARIAAIPGAVDVHLHQVIGTPELRVDVDRTIAGQVGLSEREVAGDLLVSLSSSGQTAPNFWLDGQKGVQYTLAVQTPQYKMDSQRALEGTPIGGASLKEPELLANLAHITRRVGATNITHYNVAPTIDVLANVEGADLGSVASKIDQILAEVRPTLPRGSTIAVRGQVESMTSSFRGLGFGLLFAVVLVYLLMVVNFQSWLDPLIILMALPGALAGILWMLFVSGTTLSVPSLMGAIMSIGVATSNSILLITFANDQRKLGMNAHDAALAAGMTRLRPVVMTALAMIIGMLPMSLGFGEGGEQNAPLGRAVIGGLLLATVTTLFFVPIVYSALRRKAPAAASAEESEELNAAA